MKKTRVMVVDDQSVARQLFELYLKSSECTNWFIWWSPPPLPRRS